MDPKARSVRRNPLDRYSEEAPSLFMREIAKIASSRGHNQRTLSDAVGIEPPNLGRYFGSQRPQPATVQWLADKLQLPDLYVQLLREPPLATDQDYAEFFYNLLAEIRNSETFKTETRKSLGEFLRRNPGLRKDLLREFALARFRSDAGLRAASEANAPLWPNSVTYQVRMFAKSALPQFDLHKYLRKAPKRSDSLFIIFHTFLVRDRDIPHRKAESILDVVRAVFRDNGISHEKLDEYLYDDPVFRTDEFQARSVERARSRRSK